MQIKLLPGLLQKADPSHSRHRNDQPMSAQVACLAHQIVFLIPTILVALIGSAEPGAPC